MNTSATWAQEIYMSYDQYFKQPKAVQPTRSLRNETILITGGNSGLGLESAKQLASLGLGHLILCARNLTSGAQAVQEIRAQSPDCKIELWKVDHEDYDTMIEAGRKAARLDRLDAVILNAGVMMLYYKKMRTGHEGNIQSNYLGNVFLAFQLLPALKQTAKKLHRPSRMSIVSSFVHPWTPFKERTYPSLFERFDEVDSFVDGDMQRYNTSKMLQIVWTRQMATLLNPSEVVINVVDPALCKSELHRDSTPGISINDKVYKTVLWFCGWTNTQGAWCILDAVLTKPDDTHGQYISYQKVREPSLPAEEGREFHLRLWKETLELFRKEVPGAPGIPAVDVKSL